VRKLKDSEIDWLLNFKCPGASAEDEYELLLIRKLLNSRIPGCHVAETEEGKIVFIQWLIPSTENKAIQSYFNASLPILWPNEAIIEVAFTFPEYRGLGIMPEAMSRIAEEAGTEGILRVVAFPEVHNVRTLKACKRAGFLPYIMKNERWTMLVRRLTYPPLPELLPYPF
jgi:GNAT superfamily N-acetyltransferase